MKRKFTLSKKAGTGFRNKQLFIAGISLFLLLHTQQISAQVKPVNDNTTGNIAVSQQAITDSLAAKDSIFTNAFASIGDFVWIDNNVNGLQDDGEPGMPNVEVVLYDSLLNILDSKYTNDSGYYHFKNIPVPGIGSKTFVVGFNNIPPDYAYTTQAAENTQLKETGSTPDTIRGRTNPFTLRAGEVRNDIDGGIKSSPGVRLPLIINQFNGNYADGMIRLGWNTYSEINIDHFNIERSTDGSYFRQIGKLDAVSGELTGNNNYTYLDITAERGTIYYRLALVDKNGNYTYSKVIMVAVDIKGISVMIVYPNPFSKRVQIKVNSDKAEKVMINIIHANGALMSSQPAETHIGDNNIVIQKVDALPAGIYYIEVVSSTRSLKTKVMKLN